MIIADAWFAGQIIASFLIVVEFVVAVAAAVVDYMYRMMMMQMMRQ